MQVRPIVANCHIYIPFYNLLIISYLCVKFHKKIKDFILNFNKNNFKKIWNCEINFVHLLSND